VITGLEFSGTSLPPQKEDTDWRLTVTNSQWFNQPDLHNEGSIKTKQMHKQCQDASELMDKLKW
jgi:hypothetical protein